jgi:hypothetical protein
VRTDNPRLQTQPIDLTLEVNGSEVGIQSLGGPDWHDLYYDVSAAGDEDVLRCKLRVSETWVPQNEAGSGDSRRLGVSVSYIWLE